MKPYIRSCSCGKHDFVFGEKPRRKVEVKCPACGKMVTIDQAKKIKEDDK